ncbi:MAG: hypothetical protein LBE97_01715 [Holosporales bacterium]|jgi:hypothetical protein|nr:hypothetical protein [Holosporales bacterium]
MNTPKTTYLFTIMLAFLSKDAMGMAPSDPILNEGHHAETPLPSLMAIAHGEADALYHRLFSIDDRTAATEEQIARVAQTAQRQQREGQALYAIEKAAYFETCDIVEQFRNEIQQLLCANPFPELALRHRAEPEGLHTRLACFITIPREFSEISERVAKIAGISLHRFKRDLGHNSTARTLSQSIEQMEFQGRMAINMIQAICKIELNKRDWTIQEQIARLFEAIPPSSH